jgi:hypothetical protein
MFGRYNIEIKNVIGSLASEGVTFGKHVRYREYLNARNLFDNEFLVITISRTALGMATYYSKLTEQTCTGAYSLIQVNMED